MAVTNAPADDSAVSLLQARALRLRQHMMSMARRQGQGYIAQGLAIADLLAALYFHELRYDPASPHWPDRDRFLLSTGHYSIALWAALAEARVIEPEELETYGADDSRLDMSTLDTTPGVEVIGGSLGHGLGQAIGIALGQRLRGSDARTFVELSDGEMQEGATWEGAMSAAHFRLDGLVAFIDCNGIQADGPVVLDMEPVAEKWRAFGWDTAEIDGNDMTQIVSALHAARAPSGQAPRRSYCARCPARACRRSSGARRRISCVSMRGNGTISCANWRPIMAERRRTLAMGQDETLGPLRPTVDAPFGRALVDAARSRPEIVGLTADLGKYTDILPFRDAHPDRFFNVGMAEQNLIAVAAGLARTGCIPFATTYGVFATRRAYDFIAIACAHSRLNVKIIAGLPGVTTGYGGTHQAIEDTALMRMVPGLVVIDPCDATEIAQATMAMAEYDGPVYMRLLRGQVPVVLDPATYQFRIGRAAELRSGSDAGIISTGLMTERALDAAAALEREGVAVGVLHVPTLKPFDSDAVAAFAARTERLVTAENHVTSGGLASLVAETLFEHGLHKTLLRIGLPDAFLPCGSVATLQERCGLTVPRMIEAIRAAGG